MPTAAQTSFGNQIWIAVDGQSLVKVAELLTVAPPKSARGMLDATSHDSTGGAEEVIPEGTYDPGSVTGQMHLIAGSATDLAFRAALSGGLLHDFRVVIKGAAGAAFNQTFSGYVTSYGPDDQPVKGKQAASFAIKISGAIAQAAAA